ncbi:MULTISPECIES: hypothetical protein [Vibrio]|uniref:hypothetical protein n=1 Tax=Vibrio TaxID=662 RepID=UPI000841651A|nr:MULTISPECIES: hypothetical protein [Vibrio]ODM56066.1 hypothetical protein BC455_22690 [Vibrio harveyi]USD58517.1 hypothetical protein J4N44_27880 [Vibrio sp. SCSIO 43155]
MIRKLLFSIAVLSLFGCSSKPEPKTEAELYAESPIPLSEKTMKEIYQSRGIDNNNVGYLERADGRYVNKRPATWEETRINPYVVNQTGQSNFKKLANPTITIFFMPSLTKEDRMPRPAWMTEFSMYDRDEYALPGEESLTDGQFPMEGL